MTDSRDERVMKIVDEALDLNPAQRAEFVRTACGTDLTLAADVEKLIACQDEAQRVFDAGEIEMRSLPAQVGHYRLLSVIGEGGMGVVWRAEQREPIRRTVALKLIKLGMDTNAVIARFESERQALAMMDHPNVAKVFDAGATATGRPYFVMEYVAGEAITTFCDRHGYSIRQRLELFVEACEAVQHAHQKTLIHRDLKPSNILVAQPEGQPPSVKVIDFGVAKATAQKLTERTLFTEAGQLVGTPEYMSPEQAENTGLDVDTRSDVYSLGVVLYELISGALPFDAKTLRAAGFGEIQRIIREVDPPRPSTRLSSLGEAGTEIARKRQLKVEQLAQQLRGELEWIPLKAMRKEPSKRYATATELAQDMMNYLAQRPLTAGPESASYRAKKFLRRNKGPVFAAGLVLAVLIVGIVATSFALLGQSRARAEAERQRAEVEIQRAQADQRRSETEAVNSFLINDVLSGVRPDRIPDKGVRDAIIKAMIDPAALAVTTRFRERPLIEAAVSDTLAITYDTIGRSDLGLPLILKALQIRRRLLGDDHPDTLASICNAAYVLESQGKLAESETLGREALQRCKRVLGDDDPQTRSAVNNLAHVLKERRKLDEAESLYVAQLSRNRRALGDDHPNTMSVINNMGLVLEAQGRLREAEVLYREAFERQRRVHGDDDPATLGPMNNLAAALQSLGRLDEAEPLFRELLERARRVLGNEHPNTLVAINRTARLLQARGKFDEAMVLYNETLNGRRRTLGNDHPSTLLAMSSVGNALASQRKYAEAEVLFEELNRRLPSADVSPEFAALYVCNYGLCLTKLGKFEQALGPLVDGHERLKSSGQEKISRMRDVLTALVDTCDHTGRSEEAAKWRAELQSALAATQPTSTSAPSR